VRRLHPRSWPLAVRLPAAAALLVALAGAVASWTVLASLQQVQQHHLREVIDARIAALAPSLRTDVVRLDIWQLFEALDGLVRERAGLPVLFAAVLDDAGRVLAASEPRRAPTLEPPPPELAARIRLAREGLVFADGEAEALVLLPVGGGGAHLYAEIDVSALLAERRRASALLVAGNAAFVLLTAGLAWLLVRRMLEPLERLTAAFAAVEHGGEVELSLPRSGFADAPEYRRLFRAFGAMLQSVREREQLRLRLAEEDKLARLGHLAAAMAHEINNPLAGLFTALDTLRRHGGDPDVRREALAILERGLSDIADIVRATLVAYREDRALQPLTPEALDDLRLLVRQEVERRQLKLAWDNRLADPVAVAAGPLRQALLNLLLNAARATPAGGSVRFSAGLSGGMLMVEIADGGPGLPAGLEPALTRADPSVPPRGRGLGLWIAGRLLADLGACVEVHRPETGGTLVRIALPTGIAERAREGAWEGVGTSGGGIGGG